MTLIRGKTWLAAGAVVAALAGVGACSTRADEATQASVEDTAQERLSANAMQSGAAAGDDGGGGAVGATGAPAPAGATSASIPASVSQPRIVKTATLHVEVGDGKFATSFSEVATIASGAGGFVASSVSAAGDGELSSGSLTIRVPAERFDDVRQRIRGLGTLESEELRGDDVGGQLTDLEARLRNLRAQEEAIRALMAKTNNVQETLQIQNQLSGVREQIEQIDGQRARLDDAVTFATLTVQLAEPGVTPVGEKSRLAEAIDNALGGAEAMLAGAIIALGYLVPVAVLALIAYAIVRAITRSRRTAVAATVPSAEHGA